MGTRTWYRQDHSGSRRSVCPVSIRRLPHILHGAVEIIVRVLETGQHPAFTVIEK
jgi:hypothetical protein